MQHPEITLIFTHALNAARNYLEECGAIPVFAYVLAATKEDQLRRVVPKPAAGQSAQEIVAQLRTLLSLEARTEGHRAVAIVTAEPWDGSDGNSTAVLQVAVDHVDAAPVLWQVPFRRVGERYEFGTRGGGGIVKVGNRFVFPE